MKKLNNRKAAIAAAVLCLAAIVAFTTIGISDISAAQTMEILGEKIFHINTGADIKDSAAAIIWVIRFPRVLLAFFVGGALAVCGAAYQGIFKNPMADPFILGVSSGAALGATIGIIADIHIYFLGFNAISVFAFIGALLVLFLVYNISRVGRKVPASTLLLSGIAAGQFISAIISLCMVFSNDFEDIIFWTMGSFNGKSWDQLIIAAPYIAIGFFIIYSSAREMDIMLLGEDTASQLGVETEKLKLKILVTTALMTAAAVSFTGIIGFVGLIIPHMVRIASGPKHKVLLPYSFAAGGVFMIACDTIARSFTGQELPVGVVTAFFGGPFFIYLLKKKTGRGINNG